MTTPLRSVPGSAGDPLNEAIALTKRLKLPHIRRALGDLIPTAKAQRWDPAEVVRVLLAEEAAGRDRANLHTRRKRAGFPAGKTFGDWDETASSIPRATQDALKTLEWVRRRESLCVCGPSGTGKSHFTEALGQAAVEAGMTVAWFTIDLPPGRRRLRTARAGGQQQPPPLRVRRDHAQDPGHGDRRPAHAPRPHRGHPG